MPAFAFPPSAMMPKCKSACNGLGADKIPELKKQDQGKEKPTQMNVCILIKNLKDAAAIVRI